MATTFYVTRDPIDGLFVMRAGASGSHVTASGPWKTNEVAWRQCENAAHAAAEKSGGTAEYTTTTTEVKQAADKHGLTASNSCWLVE